jgi:hypothetical protein
VQIIKYPDKAMFVDPGIGNTGWAVFHGDKHPMTGLIHPERNKRRVSTQGERMCSMWLQFGALIRTLNKKIDEVWIESVRHLPTVFGTRVSLSGSLDTLAYLIGGYWNMCERYNKKVTLVDPKWLGQLNERKMVLRVERINGRRYRQHEADAVGMGFWKAGVL